MASIISAAFMRLADMARTWAAASRALSRLGLAGLGTTLPNVAALAGVGPGVAPLPPLALGANVAALVAAPPLFAGPLGVALADLEAAVFFFVLMVFSLLDLVRTPPHSAAG